MKDDDRSEVRSEGFLSDLVAQEPLRANSAEAAADECKRQQGPLADPRAMVARGLLVEEIDREHEGIQWQEKRDELEDIGCHHAGHASDIELTRPKPVGSPPRNSRKPCTGKPFPLPHQLNRTA